MKKYEAPKADVVVFETVDVVATSVSSVEPTDEPASSLGAGSSV